MNEEKRSEQRMDHLNFRMKPRGIRYRERVESIVNNSLSSSGEGDDKDDVSISSDRAHMNF